MSVKILLSSYPEDSQLKVNLRYSKLKNVILTLPNNDDSRLSSYKLFLLSEKAYVISTGDIEFNHFE